MLQSANKCLNKKELAVVHHYLQNNSYFAHPESILLWALFSDNFAHREKALSYIVAYRSRNSARRQFKKPELNVKAKSVMDLIGFKKVDPTYITESPLTRIYSLEDLQDCCRFGIDLSVPQIPNHSQNNERAVASTTQAAAKS